jgi:hypothetical protein
MVTLSPLIVGADGRVGVRHRQTSMISTELPVVAVVESDAEPASVVGAHGVGGNGAGGGSLDDVTGGDGARRSQAVDGPPGEVADPGAARGVEGSHPYGDVCCGRRVGDGAGAADVHGLPAGDAGGSGAVDSLPRQVERHVVGHCLPSEE